MTTPSPVGVGEPIALVLALEGKRTDDGRWIAPGGVTWRELPLAVAAQTVTADGHDGAWLCGRLDRVERQAAPDLQPTDGATVVNRILGFGRCNDDADGQHAAELIAAGSLTGNSIDPAAVVCEVEVTGTDGDGNPADSLERYLAMTITKTTLCTSPAFAEGTVTLGAQPRIVSDRDPSSGPAPEIPEDAGPDVEGLPEMGIRERAERLRREMFDGAPDGAPDVPVPTIDPSGDDPDPDGPVEHTGVMVALWPPKDIADALAVPGGEQVADLHVTLAFLGDVSGFSPDPAEDDSGSLDGLRNIIGKWAAGQAPVTARLSGLATFEDGGATVALLDSPDLDQIHASLLQALTEAGVSPATDHGFTPHITLLYAGDAPGTDPTPGVQPPDALPPGLAGQPITLADLVLAVGDQHTLFPLDDQTGTDAGPSYADPQEATVPEPDVSVTASAGPMRPPAEWFTDPGLPAPTPLTITDDGRVYGHLATFGTRHTAPQFAGVTPPRGESSYRLFHVGEVLCADGTSVPVGHITMNTGHAGVTDPSPFAAAAHYDDTGTVVADVAAGEDTHGIWVAGAMRPDVDELSSRRLRAGALSGDWRPYGGRRELVAALAVNVPGFPIPRARALVADGSPGVLVAAGIVPPGRPAASRVEERIRKLELQVAGRRLLDQMRSTR